MRNAGVVESMKMRGGEDEDCCELRDDLAKSGEGWEQGG